MKSKFLAYLLRHSPLPDEYGWVSTERLIGEYRFSIDELTAIVNEDSKGRFEFSEDKTFIRALYGHTAKVRMNYAPVLPPPVLYHGTAGRFIGNIRREGLHPKKRNYVHLSETPEQASTVGSRHGSPAVLAIDTKQMLEDGYVFYNPQKGIWLTTEIGCKYFINEESYFAKENPERI